MKRHFIFISILGLAGPAFAALTADQILMKADEVRNPQIDYTMQVKIISKKPKRPDQESTYKVMVKGKDKTVVQTLAPVVDAGRILLINQNNFWGYLPNVSKPLRISLQERLAGEVANGDLARANFTGDYTPQLTGVKPLTEKKCYVLDLKAKSESVTYGRVVLWIEKNSYKPLQAEFYAFSGRLLKTCSYENYKSMGGGVRPSRLVMRDALNKEHVSTLEYDTMKLAPLADKYFTKDYMKTFQIE